MRSLKYSIKYPQKSFLFITVSAKCRMQQEKWEKSTSDNCNITTQTLTVHDHFLYLLRVDMLVPATLFTVEKKPNAVHSGVKLAWWVWSCCVWTVNPSLKMPGVWTERKRVNHHRKHTATPQWKRHISGFFPFFFFPYSFGSFRSASN